MDVQLHLMELRPILNLRFDEALDDYASLTMTNLLISIKAIF